MNAITYYKLRSPYAEDRTKNCGLTGEEIDTNFFNLKSQDIKNAYWDKENNSLVLERVDGTKLFINGILDGLTNFTVSYDPDKGILIINTSFGNYEVEGFTTPKMVKVYTDNTLNGDGTVEKPLALSPILRTGVYKPAVKVIDTTANEALPNSDSLKPHDRYVTLERISDYGLLYNFNGVKRIANDLLCQSSEWRIPSKEDWDDMLNAIEPCSEDRNHNSGSSNRSLGKLAGKLLKSQDGWLLECSGYTNDNEFPTVCDQPSTYQPNKGLDTFGFKVMPSGYGDGGNIMDYFSQRAAFWTSTQLSISDVYIKRFDFNKSTVYQEAASPSMQLSLRLVKDYNGDNYHERETINGVDYTCVLMPSLNNGMQIWTVDNVYFTNSQYGGVQPNSGYDLTYTEKYFINEWTGFGWIKHELKENESIILTIGPNGKKNQEWRVVNGSLQSIPDMVYNDVLENVNETNIKLENKINEEIDRAKEAEATIATNLQNEIDRATSAENKLASDFESARIDLQDQIVKEIDRAKEAEATIATNLQNEIDRATSADSTLNENLSAEISRAQNAENKLTLDLSNEAERAKEAETTIATNLQNEADRAKEAETTIATNLQNEADRAKNEEVRIESKLDQEITDRVNNDIKRDNEYIFKVNEGLTLFTNDGSKITINVDGDYGTY